LLHSISQCRLNLCSDSYSLCADERKCILYTNGPTTAPNSASSFQSSRKSHPHHKLSEADPSLKSSDSSPLIRLIVNAPHSRDCPSSYSPKIRKGGLAATFSPQILNPKPYPTLCLTPSISTSSLLIHQVSYQEVGIKSK
jgi:hypothetical protein